METKDRIKALAGVRTCGRYGEFLRIEKSETSDYRIVHRVSGGLGLGSLKHLSLARLAAKALAKYWPDVLAQLDADPQYTPTDSSFLYFVKGIIYCDYNALQDACMDLRPQYCSDIARKKRFLLRHLPSFVRSEIES
jgi:hypothetical protein